MAELNERQRKFVIEYLADFNATQAAIRAGYSERSAMQLGERLMRKVEIQAAIQEQIRAKEARTLVTQDRVLMEIARLAFLDPRRAFDAKGNLLPVNQWTDDIAAAISSIKVSEEKDEDGKPISTVKEIKFWDKGKQIELAGKTLRMFVDQLNLKVEGGIGERMAKIKQRMKQGGA